MEELLGLGSGFMVFTLALMIIMIVAWWRIFEKAGEPGWAALIPIYNTIVLLKVAKLSPWLIFVFLLAIIPVVGMIVVGVFSIIVHNKNNALYEHVRPFEQIAERLDGISETLKDKGDSVSNAMMDRVEHVFDSLVQSMTDEIQRCDSVIDECEDDESYPDDDDEEEEE